MAKIERDCVIINQKVTPFKKKDINKLTKYDVFARVLNDHAKENHTFKQSMDVVFKELVSLSVLKNDEVYNPNFSRSFKKIIAKWINIKKSTKIQKKKFVEELNTPFKIKVYQRPSNKKSISQQFDDTYIDDFDICDNLDVESDNDLTENVKFQDRSDKKKKLEPIINLQLTSALDRSKVSNRNAVHILAAASKSLNVDVKKLVLNRESVRLARKKDRFNIVSQVKESFAPNCSLTIHWDGKIMEDLATTKKVDRLAVYVTGQNVVKQLGIPKLLNGTGNSQANAVLSLVNEWKLADRIHFMCFDTTASNTGIRNGACKIIEDKLGKPLIGLACRHHIIRLIVSNVFKCTMEQKTSGPEICIFQKFQTCWDDIDKSKFKSGIFDSEIFNKIKFEKNGILKFINEQMSNIQPRGDYRELLELSAIFLGQKISNYKFKAPGAMHRARWMSKIIYCIKIFLFRSEVHYMTPSLLSNLKNFLLFIFKIYLKHWFTAANAISAPLNDLTLLKSIKKYDKENADVSVSANNVFGRHLWYLNTKLAALAFFDDKINNNEKIKMVYNLNNKKNTANEKRISFSNDLLKMQLSDFISTQSKTLFTSLNLKEDFLLLHPQYWHNNQSYIDNKLTVYNF